MRTEILKHLLGAREEGAKEMSGEERWSRYVSIIEKKEVRGDNAIEYLLPTWVRSTFFESQKV